MAGFISAQFFDGHTAATKQAQVGFTASGLRIVLDDAPGARDWSFSGLQAVEFPQTGQPLRLKHSKEPSARLIVPIGQSSDYILSRAPHLADNRFWPNAAKFLLIGVTGLCLVAILGYGVLSFAPHKIAEWMPDEWRENLGESTEKAFIKNAKQCANPVGKVALARIASRVAASSDNPPDFSVRVFDLPIVNAFALPGGRIIITSALIKQADSAEELAGVLAHELGHVAFRHPEASMVRVVGLQLLLSVATGGTGGDALGSLASLVTILRYSRGAEEEADDYARQILANGAIDPRGLRSFFEKLSKKESKGLEGKFGKFSDMLSTHPGTNDRIESFVPLPEGQGRQVIGEDDWLALKNICR